MSVSADYSCVYCYIILHAFSGSLPVKNFTQTSPDNSTLLLEWMPPTTPNGVVLNYVVKIILISNGEIILEESISDTSYSASRLSMLSFITSSVNLCACI